MLPTPLVPVSNIVNCNTTSNRLTSAITPSTYSYASFVPSYHASNPAIQTRNSFRSNSLRKSNEILNNLNNTTNAALTFSNEVQFNNKIHKNINLISPSKSNYQQNDILKSDTQQNSEFRSFSSPKQTSSEKETLNLTVC